MVKRPKYKIENVVASVEADAKIDLNLLARKQRDAEYNPEQFPGLMLRVKSPKATILVFNSGRMVITGLRRESEAEFAVENVVAKIRKAGITVSGKPKITVQNIVASGDLHSRVDLGSDGWLYFSTHRGSTRITTAANHFKGGWIMRFHPQTGKGEIVAEVRPDQLRIVTKDSGPGIADIEQAMQPGFSTAPEWVREMGFGAGMGLNNIQNCADVMRVESEVGVGTRLEIIIHIAENDLAPAKATSA